MSQIWIERLRAATSKVERDEILLWELNEVARRRYRNSNERERLTDEVAEQMRALADLVTTPER